MKFQKKKYFVVVALSEEFRLPYCLTYSVLGRRWKCCFRMKKTTNIFHSCAWMLIKFLSQNTLASYQEKNLMLVSATSCHCSAKLYNLLTLNERMWRSKKNKCRKKFILKFNLKTFFGAGTDDVFILVELWRSNSEAWYSV